MIHLNIFEEHALWKQVFFCINLKAHQTIRITLLSYNILNASHINSVRGKKNVPGNAATSH